MLILKLIRSLINIIINDQIEYNNTLILYKYDVILKTIGDFINYTYRTRCFIYNISNLFKLYKY